MRTSGTLKLGVMALAAAFAMSAQAQTEVQWWHAMSGPLGEWVTDLVTDFNQSQDDYKVVPTYKGGYGETLTAAMAAFRSGKAPAILQVYEVGTATMMAAKGAVKPVSEVMAMGDAAFDPDAYVPAVAGYYTAPDGQMLSLPFNSSTTVFYYNKDAFRSAGLDPEKAPTTWSEVFEAAQKLADSGHTCPFTTSWMSWTQLESFSTWHNVEFGTLNNGFDGTAARLAFDSPLHVRHFDNLAKMAKAKQFVYQGRTSKADVAFPSGECAMLTASSGVYARVANEAKFDYGISPLPYYPDVEGAPQNTVIGGASLWVMEGHNPDVYKGVAAFFNYLSQPEVQSESHKRTGYLPITMAAFKLTEDSGFYDEHPGTDVAVTQMIRKTTDKSRGIRLGNFNQIRTIINEETEKIWTGATTPEAALKTAVERGNEQLARFERANR